MSHQRVTDRTGADFSAAPALEAEYKRVLTDIMLLMRAKDEEMEWDAKRKRDSQVDAEKAHRASYDRHITRMLEKMAVIEREGGLSANPILKREHEKLSADVEWFTVLRDQGPDTPAQSSRSYYATKPKVEEGTESAIDRRLARLEARRKEIEAILDYESSLAP